MKTLLLASLLVCGAAFAASPSSINNDDSCEIKVGPAATLLLPYFEVDVNGTSGQTTLFTITNVTRFPQIAHVTLWTDWAYPALDFNIFLTGYDVQAINLYDVIARGVIAPPSGTTSATTPGGLSSANNTNPNVVATSRCTNLVSTLPAAIRDAVKSVFTTGVYRTDAGLKCATAGGAHEHAIGYATIDVVSDCTNLLPNDPRYYTSNILFDNVLIGDYQQLGARPAGTGTGPFEAGGNPMVHIRAVPEGGGAGSIVATGLPYTFYDRYTPKTNRVADRRQPLPSTFAARYVQGGSAGLATNLTSWREGVLGTEASCTANPNNSVIHISEIVRFDEHENEFAFQSAAIGTGPVGSYSATTSSENLATSSNYPSLSSVDSGGWIYLNLDAGGGAAYSVTSTNGSITTGPVATPLGFPRPSQNWVTITMFGTAGTNRLATEFDASPLGNGCSPTTPGADFLQTKPMNPAGGVFLCPPGTTLTNGTTTLCTGTNGNPKP